jgi:hypothetical protein
MAEAAPQQPAGTSGQVTPPKIEVLQNNRISVEFGVEQLVQRLLQSSMSHCGGCYGCGGCSHIV